jgi:hypothetical protein
MMSDLETELTSPREQTGKPLADTLIICDRLSGLEDRLNQITGPVRFLTLVDNNESRDACDWLRSRPDTIELSKPDLFRERSSAFWRRYIEFFGRLNVQNHSRDWWAMTFTAKSPLASELGLHIFQFLLMVELLKHESEPLVVISDSPELIAQAKAWAINSAVNVSVLSKPTGGFRRFIKFNTPAGILRASARTFILWLLTIRFRATKNPDEGHLVIVTQTHPQSFNGSEPYRDSYFGPLIDHVISGQRKAMILSLMVGRPFEQLKTIKSREFRIPIRPVESWITFKDVVACTFRALRGSMRRFDPAEPVEFDGVDVENLVGSTIKEARGSGDYFLNLIMYYCGRFLGRSLNVEKCLYPFENRAWEKSLLQGLRETSGRTQIVGYQHASVSPIHANFFLGEGEAAVAHLPDQILTTGNVVQEWLEEAGNYPEGLFKTACALRQNNTGSNTPKPRRSRANRVLVALATNFTEHVNTVVFVERGLGDTDEFEVRIRPHPAFSLDQVVAAAPIGNRDFFRGSPGSLADDMDWADVVLYATSTVGLEAVSLGIPAVRLDLGEFLDTDPMFGWNEFKWSVGDPSHLLGTVRNIGELSEDEYADRQRKGIEYSLSYLKPVTENGLRLFSETPCVKSF